MSSTLVKVGVGLAGATTIGGGATAIYLTSESTKTEKQPDTSTQNNPIVTTTNTSKAISAWLNDEGKTLLVDDATEWDDNWTKFKGNYALERLPDDPWKLGDWKDVFSSNKAPASFKQKCKDNSNTVIDSTGSPLYTQLKTNCTKQSA